MQRIPRLIAAFISFSSIGIKFMFPLFLAYFGTDKDFSFLLVTYNTILLSGMIFSLEHNKFYHRKAIHKNKIKKINFYERVYFDQTLILKLIPLIITLILFDKFSILQRILIFLIVYIDLHLVEECRKNEVIGNYLRNVMIWGARMAFPVILFIITSLIIKDLFLNLLFLNILFSYILIINLFKVRICNIKNLKIKKNIFINITVRTWQYALLTILGLLNPLVDKFVLLNFKEYSMLQTISLWAVFGNLVALFISEFINKPYKPKIMNFLNIKDFNRIFKNIISYQILLMVFVFIILIFYRTNLEFLLKPSFEFNLLQILGCCFISASIPLNTLFNTTLYGYKKDNSILIFTIFEFFLKYLFSIITILYLGAYYLPYILSLEALVILLAKYVYVRKSINKFLSNITS